MAHKVYLAWQETTPGQGSGDGRKLLEALYRQVTGEPMPELLCRSEGKPYFAHGCWHCSISHTRQAVFCGLSMSPLGLDAEPEERQVSQRLMNRVLSSGERAQIRSSSREQEGFLTHWVLKEAYVKYTGRGIRGDLAALDFRVDADRAELTGQSLWFRVSRMAGHILAICREEEGEILWISGIS